MKCIHKDLRIFKRELFHMSLDYNFPQKMNYSKKLYDRKRLSKIIGFILQVL